MTDGRTANIISFASRATSASTQNLRAMHDYWEGLRNGRRLPLRSDIDPRDISHLLESGFLLEHMGTGDVRFRLAGMKIGDLMGMDVRSMPMRALISPAQRPVFTDSLESVFSGPELHTYRLVSEHMGQPTLKAAMIILPLLSDTGEISRALGTFAFEGRLGFTPRRFRIVERLRSGLDDTAGVDDVTRFDTPPVTIPLATPIQHFAEQQAEFTPAHPKASHLRVVK